LNWYKIAEGENHEYSCVMLPLSYEVGASILSFGSDIPDSELAEDGREDSPHVTVLYGLHTNNVQDIKDALKGESDIKLTLGKTKIFPANEKRDSDVVIIEIISDDLHRLNKKLCKLDYTNKYDEYKPHATIAYVKPGEGKKYEGKSVCSKTITVNEIEFSSKSGERTKFSLGKKEASSNWYRLMKSSQRYEDVSRDDHDDNESFEASQYFSIGHNEEEGEEEDSYCWVISPMGQFQYKAGGTHAINFGVQSRAFWRGWYDPQQRLLSVVFPRDRHDAGKKDWTMVPKGIKKILNEASEQLGWAWLPKVF
jgi:2'-5' RNA ligase